MAAFAGKHIEGSGGSRSIHKFEPDPTSREREHEVTRREFAVFSCPDHDEFRLVLEEH